MTRKMQMFYATIFVIILMGIFSFFTSVTFTGDQLTNIIVVFMVFVGAMAGANVGEHFAKAKANGSKTS